MTTKEMFPNEYRCRPDVCQRRYVTLALSSSDKMLGPDMSGYGYGKEYRLQYVGRNGACLVFDAGDREIERNMSSVAKTSFVKALFGSRFWLTGFSDKVVVAHDIVGISGLENPPIHFGHVRDRKYFSWSEMHLYKYCLNVAKFSHCFACESAEDIVPCVRNKIEQAMKELDVAAPFEEVKNDGSCSDALYDEKELERFLQKTSATFGWTYVKPGNMAAPFAPKLSRAIDIHMDDVESNLGEARARWELGKKTTVAVKRCEEECYICDWCNGCSKPYHSTPLTCQTGNNYMSGSLCGPFSEEEFNEAYRVARLEMCARPEYEIRQIACNSGISTWIFGYELELCKMAPNLRDVQFVRPTTMERFTFSFKDAMTLLHTPYRDGKDHLDGRRYQYPGMQEIQAKMSELALNTYTEACQYDYGQPYSTYFPGCYAEPQIRGVKWSIMYDNLDLCLKPGWSYTLKHPGQAYMILGRNWRPLPNIVNNHLDQIREQRVQEVPETNQDKQP